MKRSRRSFLQDATALSATFTAGHIVAAAAQSQSGSPKVGYKRIATEEAWAPSDLVATYRKMAASKSIDDPGFVALWQRLGANAQLVARLSDMGEGRIRDMDATGIEMQVLSLTSPGVQVFDAATANKIASDSNDQLAEAIRKYPTREYMKENIYVTTSGMAWSPVITFLQSVLGVERVLYAMDYPYQYEPDEVIATDSVPISKSDKKKLFQTNAEKVFAL